MATIGKVQTTAQKTEFEWRIEKFFALPAEVKKYYLSPCFSFAGESWYLGIYPNGQSSQNTDGYVSLYLNRKESGPPISVTASLGLRTFDGKKDHKKRFTYVYENSQGYRCHNFLMRSTLSEKKMELVPSDILTIVCTVKYILKTYDNIGKNETAKSSQCEESFVFSKKRKYSDKPAILPTCTNVNEPRKCFDVRVKAIEKCIDDLGNIFNNEEHSDVTIEVKGVVFHLHRCILAGRNPYFSSMFKTEMKEKTTGVVTIDDCEPDVFRSFIQYVYTGKLDDLSLENVCDLYKVADKYQEDQLKEECLCFMNNKMSVESFCDFIVLALEYNEKELLQNATELFCKKVKEIIQSVKWQTFMREYPTQANELNIKALDYIMPSK